MYEKYINRIGERMERDMSKSLKQYIRNLQADDRTLLTRLNKVTGYCPTSGAISKWLDKPERELDSFQSLIAIVKEVYPHDEISAMVEYSKTLSESKKAARHMLEWLSVNRQIEAFGELLDRMKNCKSSDAKEWAGLYDFIYQVQTNYSQLDFNQQLRDLAMCKTTTNETYVFRRLLEIYTSYYKKDFKATYELCNGLENLINDIKEEYIKTTYLARLYEMKGYVSLKVLNKPKTARKFADKSIKLSIGQRYVAYAYFVKGLSYMFESYDKSKYNLEKSRNLYEDCNYEISVTEVEDKLELLNAFWDVDTSFDFKQHEAYYNAKHEEHMPNDINITDEAYRLLIEGVYKKDENTLVESLIEYLRRGDTFLGQMPKIELAKMGYNEGFINRLMTINRF